MSQNKWKVSPGWTNQDTDYHWWELPQLLFLSWQKFWKFCHDKHVFVATKHVFCRDKSMLIMTELLLWQTHVCHAKYLSCQMICQDKNILSRQNYDKSFVAARILLLWQKTCFVTTNTCLSWQNFCRDKNDTCGSSCQWQFPPYTQTDYVALVAVFHCQSDQVHCCPVHNRSHAHEDPVVC